MGILLCLIPHTHCFCWCKKLSLNCF